MQNRYLKLSIQNFLLMMCLTLGMHCRSENRASKLPMIQSLESYDAAIHNYSTSPSYVLIFIADRETGQAKPICTTANFLLGAIHREYGLGYGIADLSMAAEIAAKSPGRLFRFNQQSALNNIAVKYTANDLSAARALLAPWSTEELKSKFSSLSREARLPTDNYAREAIACALIERGFSPKLADISGQVYVDR
ncbi:hypothetical protein [Janthinobacterium sp. UMAB-56]|uniref:hypothetical protein n=1 Tax=Janthinobacterium sp. UMAB-56 TaxID=1365361 RepID=UPI001C589258|nr:hypothetical protein [Janthinobacterium sp. UMAB-56]